METYSGWGIDTDKKIIINLEDGYVINQPHCLASIVNILNTYDLLKDNFEYDADLDLWWFAKEVREVMDCEGNNELDAIDVVSERFGKKMRLK